MEHPKRGYLDTPFWVFLDEIQIWRFAEISTCTFSHPDPFWTPFWRGKGPQMGPLRWGYGHRDTPLHTHYPLIQRDKVSGGAQIGRWGRPKGDAERGSNWRGFQRCGFWLFWPNVARLRGPPSCHFSTSHHDIDLGSSPSPNPQDEEI